MGGASDVRVHGDREEVSQWHGAALKTETVVEITGRFGTTQCADGTQRSPGHRLSAESKVPKMIQRERELAVRQNCDVYVSQDDSYSDHNILSLPVRR